LYTVYGIRNKYNGRVYIGSTVNYHKRVVKHSYQLRLNTHKNRRLQKDFVRYGGSDAFHFFIICETAGKDIALKFEQVFIDGFPETYNILPKAGKARGRSYTKVTLDRMSNAAKGRKLSDHLIELMRKRQTGKKASEETRKKMQATQRKRAELGLMKITSILDEAKAMEILLRHSKGEDRRLLAEEFGVAYNTVCHLVRGETWKKVYKQFIESEASA
jgi:group I intron endonuclease